MARQLRPEYLPAGTTFLATNPPSSRSSTCANYFRMISIIIPTLNEEKTIRNTIAYVYQHAAYKRLLKEVIVVDGGSIDRTVAEAGKTGATVMVSPRKGRAAQLNYGAKQASGEILYFLQGNTLPPENFISEIVKASSKGYAGGTFSLKFDYRHWLLNAVSWLTNNASWVYLSDQSLFVTKELFDKSGGFREDHLVMANHEIIKRIKRYTNFIVIQNNIISSARKYLRTGIIRAGLVQGTVYLMHKLGYPQRVMTNLYRKFLRWDIGPKTEKVKTEKKLSASEKSVSVGVAAAQSKKGLKVVS
jgi:rSAM/selenodomain-associated transferase 2